MVTTKGRRWYQDEDIWYQGAQNLQVVVPGSVVERRNLGARHWIFFVLLWLMSILVSFDDWDRPYFRQDGSTFLCCVVRPIRGEAETQVLPVLFKKFAFVISFTVFFCQIPDSKWIDTNIILVTLIPSTSPSLASLCSELLPIWYKTLQRQQHKQQKQQQ